MSLGLNTFCAKTMVSRILNYSITAKPLRGSANYLSWSYSIQLWGKGKGVQHHLIKQAKDINLMKRIRENGKGSILNCIAYCGNLLIRS